MILDELLSGCGYLARHETLVHSPAPGCTSTVESALCFQFQAVIERAITG